MGVGVWRICVYIRLVVPDVPHMTRRDMAGLGDPPVDAVPGPVLRRTYGVGVAVLRLRLRHRVGGEGFRGEARVGNGSSHGRPQAGG